MNRTGKRLFGLLIVTLVMGLGAYASAEDVKAPEGGASFTTSQGSKAKVTSIVGEAQFTRKGQTEPEMLEKNVVLSEGDSVRTAPNTIVMLELTGKDKTAEVVVKPESQFTLQTFSYDPIKKTENTLLNIQAGSILVKAQKLVGESKFEVKTPTSIVGIRGTTFEVQVEKS